MYKVILRRYWTMSTRRAAPTRKRLSRGQGAADLPRAIGLDPVDVGGARRAGAAAPRGRVAGEEHLQNRAEVVSAWPGAGPHRVRRRRLAGPWPRPHPGRGTGTPPARRR